ncbi:MAG: nucleoside-diphosphate kinase, partial [Phycisphaerales bacterium]
METTLIILKPDAVQRGLMGRLVTRFEDKGLQMTNYFGVGAFDAVGLMATDETENLTNAEPLVEVFDDFCHVFRT